MNDRYVIADFYCLFNKFTQAIIKQQIQVKLNILTVDLFC